MYDFVHNFCPPGYFVYETKGVSTRNVPQAAAYVRKNGKTRT